MKKAVRGQHRIESEGADRFSRLAPDFHLALASQSRSQRTSIKLSNLSSPNTTFIMAYAATTFDYATHPSLCEYAAAEGSSSRPKRSRESSPTGFGRERDTVRIFPTLLGLRRRGKGGRKEVCRSRDLRQLTHYIRSRTETNSSRLPNPSLLALKHTLQLGSPISIR
jgi:hypothetical protein